MMCYETTLIPLDASNNSAENGVHDFDSNDIDWSTASPLCIANADDVATVSNMNGETIFLPSTTTMDASTHSFSSRDTPDAEHVNVILIVDPVRQQVVCPRQMLSYGNDGHHSSKMLQPAVLDSIPNALVQHWISTLQNDCTANEVCSSRGSPLNPGPSLSPVTSNMSLPRASSASTTQSSTTFKSTWDSVSWEFSVSSIDNGHQPLRALSAYNFFFRDERERIVSGQADGTTLAELTQVKELELLEQHWHQDRTKKRAHRKSHGKIDFTSLTKLISARWKELPESGKDFYKRVAAKDWERYQRELNAIKDADMPKFRQYLNVTG